MKVIHTLRMDLARCGGRPTVAAVQGEANTRVLEVSLYDNSIGWEIPAAAVVDIAYQKPDGTKGIYSKLPDGTPATTFSGNVLTAILAPQVLTCAGTIRAAFVFSKEGTETLATFPFTITVEANPAAGAERSEDYFNPKDISDLRAEMAAQATDLRAEMAAQATDLRAEMEAHATDTNNPHQVTAEQVGAAPTGFGLGVNKCNTSTWNDASANGFYSSANKSPNDSRWTGINISPFAGVCYQLAFSNMNGRMLEATRKKNANVWDEWEYVNPPMELDVVYRTTERFNGKPVYVKFFNCGALPNASYKEFNVAENICDIVKVDGYLENNSGYSDKIPLNMSKATDLRFYGDNRFRLTTTTDESSMDAYVAVYYTLSE